MFTDINQVILFLQLLDDQNQETHQQLSIWTSLIVNKKKTVQKSRRQAYQYFCVAFWCFGGAKN